MGEENEQESAEDTGASVSDPAEVVTEKETVTERAEQTESE